MDGGQHTAAFAGGFAGYGQPAASEQRQTMSEIAGSWSYNQTANVAANSYEWQASPASSNHPQYQSHQGFAQTGPSNYHHLDPVQPPEPNTADLKQDSHQFTAQSIPQPHQAHPNNPANNTPQMNTTGASQPSTSFVLSDQPPLPSQDYPGHASSHTEPAPLPPLPPDEEIPPPLPSEDIVQPPPPDYPFQPDQSAHFPPTGLPPSSNFTPHIPQYPGCSSHTMAQASASSYHQSANGHATSQPSYAASAAYHHAPADVTASHIAQPHAQYTQPAHTGHGADPATQSSQHPWHNQQPSAAPVNWWQHQPHTAASHPVTHHPQHHPATHTYQYPPPTTHSAPQQPHQQAAYPHTWSHHPATHTHTPYTSSQHHTHTASLDYRTPAPTWPTYPTTPQYPAQYHHQYAPHPSPPGAPLSPSTRPVSHPAKSAAPIVATSLDIQSLLKPPGRDSRPKKLLLLIRGLPGSGKSMLARAVKDAETAAGGQAPRIHSMDDYFMVEVEKEVADEERKGKKRKVVELEYCYEEEAEASYEKSLMKAAGRTLESGKYPLVMVEAPLVKAEDVKEYWNLGQRLGYEVYVVQPLSTDPEVCHRQCVHGRSLEAIQQLAALWEPTPLLFTQVDASSLFTAKPPSLSAPGMASNPAAAPGSSNSRTDAENQAVDDMEAAPSSSKASRWEDGSAEHESHGQSDASRGKLRAAAGGSGSRWEEEAAEDKPTSSKRQKLRTDEDILQGLNDFLGATGVGRCLSPVSSNQAAAGAGAKNTARGVLKGTDGSGGGSLVKKKVTWADEAPDVEGFRIGGSARQLEEVFVLDGLGPPKELHDGDGPTDAKAVHPTSKKFKDQVKAEHTSEHDIFRDVLFGRRGGLKSS